MGTRSRKVVAVVLLGLAVLVTVALAVRAIFNYTSGQKLEAALARAKASGFPISGRDIAPADCANKNNAAPLWKAAEALIALPEGDTKRASVEAIESLFNGKPLGPGSRELLSAWVTGNPKVIELIREASSKPCFLYDTSDVPFWDKPMPDAIKLLHAARLLAVQALISTDGPDWREGLSGCLDGMRFFRNLANADGSVLVMGLITIADLKMVVAGFNRIVQSRDMGDKELVAFINEFDAAAWRRKFARIIRAEGVLGIEWGLALIAGDPRVVADGSPFFHPAARTWERVRNWILRPLLKARFRRGLEWCREVDKILLLPYHEQREAYDRLLASFRPDLEDEDPLDNIMMWDHRAALMKEATLEAMMQATKAGLACKVYRNTNGRYPERLEALVPSVLTEVPLDPFTGKPLLYRLSGDELLIYSVGSNGRDDGGRQTYQITQLVMEKDDDWSWRERF